MQKTGIVVLYVAGALIITSIVAGFFLAQRTHSELTNSSSQSSPYSKEFVGVCSGMDMTKPEVHLIAMAECLGRVRGFVDGHLLSVAVNNLAGLDSVGIMCTPPNTTSDQLLTSIMDWVDANPAEYKKVRDDVNANNVATAIIIQALRRTYPCVNS